MILVTGAGGTVGSEVVQELTHRGAKFRAAYNSPKKAEEAGKRGIDTVVIDYSKPETLDAALKGVDKLFLLSGGGGDQAQMEINAVDAAKRAGVKHIVKLSVWGAAEEGFSFAKMHRPIERAIEASGIPYTFLRPNGFMQNMKNFYAGLIKEKGSFFLPGGETRISHVDVRDIASVAGQVLTTSGHDGKAYDLTGPEGLTYGQIAEKLSAATGKKINYVPISNDDFRKGMIGSGMPEPYADAMIDLIKHYEGGHASRVTSSVKDVTGKEPRSFDDFARDHRQAFL